MKEEKKTERRLSKEGDAKKKVKVVKRKVSRCMESVDSVIRKVLGKTAKTRVVAKSRVKEEEVNKCAPGSNSSMRSIVHEARQERKVFVSFLFHQMLCLSLTHICAQSKSLKKL